MHTPKELYDAAKTELWMYTFSEFLYKADEMLNARLSKDVLEKVEEVEQQHLTEEDHAETKQKLFIFCEGRSDVEILSILSERVLQKFAVDKEIEIVSANGGSNVIAIQLEVYAKISDFDISDIVVVIDGDYQEQVARQRILSKGIDANNLIVINPSIERWLVSDLNKLKNGKIIKDIRRGKSLRQLSNGIDIDELIAKDPEFAKFVRILVDDYKN